MGDSVEKLSHNEKNRKHLRDLAAAYKKKFGSPPVSKSSERKRSSPSPQPRYEKKN